LYRRFTIIMGIAAISSPLVLSCMLRVLVEDNLTALLADNLLVVVLVQWMPPLWTTLIIALTTCIGLAFYETRAECMNHTSNFREISPNHKSFSSATNGLEASHSRHSPSGGKTGMCPIKSFQPLGLTENTSRPLPNESAGRHAHGFCRETEEKKELHGKPILFPCHLSHRRIAPFRDGFPYSYLYVGMPVGLHACYCPILCVDQPHDPKSKWPFRRAWFNIRAQDHAIREGAHMTMAQKLREYLLSEVSVQINHTSYMALSSSPVVSISE
jgi:hypothetical protein